MSLTRKFLVTLVTSRGAKGQCKLLYGFSKGRRGGGNTKETRSMYNHSLPKIFRKFRISSATDDQGLLVFYKWKQRILKGNGDKCFSI